MKSITIIYFVVLAITLFITAYAAPSKSEIQSSHKPRKYDEMKHVFVNFLIDVLSTIRKNIANDDEVLKGIERLQLKFWHIILNQFLGKMVANSDDSIGKTLFSAVIAFFTQILKAAENKYNLNQGDPVNELNKESLPIPAIVQILMSH